MTLATMQVDESVTLSDSKTDFRRQGLVELAVRSVEGRSVLDLRCLGGDIVLRLLKGGREVTGLDGCHEAVALTNERAALAGFGDDTARLWDLREVKRHVGERTFDTVLCLDLLNHVDSDVGTLNEIHDVMREGGQLILLVPAFPGLLGERDRSLGHLRRYNRADIRGLLADCGFETTCLRAWNALALAPYFFVEKILRRRLSDGLRFGGSDPARGFIGPLLRFWYRHVERVVSFPAGLSIFVIARRI